MTLTNDSDNNKPKAPDLAGPDLVESAFAAITHRLIRNDPEAAREILDGLPLEDRARIAARFHGSDRVTLIFASAEARELVQALPAPELWITIKEIGEEESLDLIRLAHPAQLQHLFDLEWWHKRSLDPLAAAFWIMILNEAGPETALEWFRQADEELLTATLARYFTVYKTDPDNQGAEPWRDLHNTWTLDDVYYLHFKDPNLAPVIEQFLKTVRAEEPMRYYALLDMIEFALTPELDEAAYRFRMARLADFGFLDYDESLEIYAPLSDRELKELSRLKARPAAGPDTPRAPAAGYPLALAEAPPLFREALARIEDADTIEDIQVGLSAVVNHVLIADSMDLSKLASVKQALMKAQAFVEMGLSRWAGDDAEEAALLLRSQSMMHLFRAGFTRVWRLGREAKRERKEGLMASAQGLELLGEDGSLVEGLTRPRPLYYAGADDKGAPVFREFLTPAEVARAEEALRRSRAVVLLFTEALAVSGEELGLLKEHHLGRALTWPTVFLTGVGQALSGRGMSFKPLLLSEAKAALKIMLTRELPHRVRDDVRVELLQRVEDSLSALAHAGEEEKKYARAFVLKALEGLEREAGEIDLTALDPRFFPAMVVLPE